MAARKSRFHTGGVFRLNTDDFYLWVDRLYAECNTGGKSAAADGNEDGIHVLERVDYLESDRALPDDDVAVVERVDVDVAVLFLQFEAVSIGVVEPVAVEYDGRAEGPRRLHL